MPDLNVLPAPIPHLYVLKYVHIKVFERGGFFGAGMCTSFVFHLQTQYPMLFLHYIFSRTDGALIGGEGEVGVMEGEGEEEGGWDVGDDDLDLPPDLVGAV